MITASILVNCFGLILGLFKLFLAYKISISKTNMENQQIYHNIKDI